MIADLIYMYLNLYIYISKILFFAYMFEMITSLSIRLSHGWISQKQLKLGLWNFRHTV